MNVLVTGERDWSDPARIYTILSGHVLRASPPSHVDLYVGDCSRGADKAAKDWWQKMCSLGYIKSDGSRVYEFVADWAVLGLAAGPSRNRDMVDAFVADGGGPAFAFWSGRRSKSGTLDCMAYAVSKGVDMALIARMLPR